MNLLKGYLTYLMAGIALVYGIYEVSTGNQTSGMEAVWAGLGLFGVRRAIGA